ncbi:HDOD domain-containing protein [Arhodomonas aquaeolei]|uniref:EAL and HDOD domain-containing protein n=1 Tax=Arhodomonas aquaeolei TaxID=2369 RepID=UPI00216833FF|nr:HDOD domain-containing protein [Arhodomonas aquaeolei]MCS4504467.1 HDOD domain-containing protein [Arhodomonas aquaeolei]
MTETATQVLMARQPIFDTGVNVVAYELLYRSPDGRGPGGLVDGDRATSEVLISRYTSLHWSGGSSVVPAFVNLPQDMLEAESLPAVPPAELVIEVLEDASPTPALITALERYRETGYRIALDDFAHAGHLEPLIALADVVKLDVQALGERGLAEQVRLLAPHNVTLLAEKVETREEFEHCRTLGCTLFQGYFLRRPELLTGRVPESNRIVLLQLLAAFADPDVSTRQLIELIERDPPLTYRLLRVLNSCALGVRHPVSSLKEALVLLGRREVHKWVALLVLGARDGTPTELVRQALTVSRMSELLAGRSGRADPDRAFFAGLLRHMDALLDIPRETLLAEIDIGTEIREALEGGHNDVGDVLGKVCLFVDGRWTELPRGDDPAMLQGCYADSLDWTNETMQSMFSVASDP